jgi:DNA-binding NtrC family response regulator
VIEIKIPPLRERKDDVEVLARHFIQKFNEEHKRNIKGFDKAAMTAIMAYSWPGNVRELKNVVERAVVLAEGQYITLDNLPDKLRQKTEHVQETSPLKVYLGDYEKGLLIKTYHSHNRNKEETARALGIDLATLYRKFKKFGIEE